jgi:hypothetical protein
MSTTSHIKMHQEHGTWRAEDNFWRDEVALWEKEIKEAAAQLPKLETVLNGRLESLRTHAASIRLYEQDVAEHEHALTEFERGDTGEKLIRFAGAHQTAAAKHAEERTQHEAIKRHHHQLMAHWKLLTDSLSLRESCCTRHIIQ